MFCIVCKQLGYNICIECLKKIQLKQNCIICASNYYNNQCACNENIFSFRYTYAGFQNNIYFKPLAYDFKSSNTRILKILTQNTAQNFIEFLEINKLPKPNILLPIPISNKKLLSRGYNQSTIIAKTLSKYLGIPYSNNIIFTDTSKNQHFLGKNQRLDNTQNKFYYKDIQNLSNLNLLIVDDIFTTGATLNQISLDLKDKVSSIGNFVLARSKYYPYFN